MDAVRVLMSKLETEPSIARSHPQRFFISIYYASFNISGVDIEQLHFKSSWLD